MGAEHRPPGWRNRWLPSGCCIPVRWAPPSVAAWSRSGIPCSGIRPGGRRASTGRALAAELTGVTFDRLSRSLGDPVRVPAARGARRGAQVAATGFGGFYVDANAISVATAARVASARHRGAARPTSTAGSSGRRPKSPGTPGSTCPARAPPRCARPVRPVGARRADRRGPAVRGVGGEDGLRGVDQGQLGAAARGPGAGPCGAAWSARCSRSGRCPARPGRAVERAADAAAAKGWRWVAEMEEIAASMAAAGLPPGFHEAAAEIYDRASQADRTPTSRSRLQELPSPPRWNTVISGLM